MHYVLTYDLASDYLARRPDFRAESVRPWNTVVGHDAANPVRPV